MTLHEQSLHWHWFNRKISISEICVAIYRWYCFNLIRSTCISVCHGRMHLVGEINYLEMTMVRYMQWNSSKWMINIWHELPTNTQDTNSYLSCVVEIILVLKYSCYEPQFSFEYVKWKRKSFVFLQFEKTCFGF